ncbi:stage III sporulation protein AA [Peribacillus muralis]|uniref:Stage III sporulation protein AA n=1 Tax=Peribacillus muralis TaxID=264697 RepID=A0A1B3XR58_9BACI|nr:stage III sporulation protein AA [Peribacillus muralis]AOH55667.1 stage III sporulation protein AA [Peribacillus muralis]
METILSFLPKTIYEQLQGMTPMMIEKMEELRIRIGRPLEVIIGGEPFFFSYAVTKTDADQLLNQIGQFSLYTLEEELKRGYITIAGGHRVGLAGKVILENGAVKAIRDISSFNFRIAREKVGVAEPLTSYLYNGEWQHTLLIGAPQTGKTTVLRDIARMISSGNEKRGIAPQKVGIVDERSEIAGSVHGVPQLEFGTRLDVLDGCPKAEGMMMMIRSMSPDVLVVDEIGRAEDTQAVLEAVNAGIKLMITTHGHTLEEMKKRPFIAEILKQNIFERFIELQRTKAGTRSYKVLNADGVTLFSGESVKRHV